jgi:membrane-associated protein
MIKYFISCIVCIAFSANSFCQDSMRIQVTNQYKQAAENSLIKVNGVERRTNDSGYINISRNADSVTLSRELHSDTKVAVATLENNAAVVMKKDFAWTDLLTPMFYILAGGIWLLLFIIFAETGLFVGFFFPGDSLLFVAGILSTPLVESINLNTGNDFLNLLIIAGLCTIAGVLGNTVGYYTGKFVGPAMFNWRDRYLFKKKYLVQARDFYDKHGGAAIVFARFLPFIRTFAPIVAGIVNMEKKKFGFFNIVGCIAWVTSMLFLGHYLNEFTKKQFGFDLEKHLEAIVIGIVLLTTAPVLIKVFFGKKKSRS